MLLLSVLLITAAAEVQTVPKVDLEKYAGKWHEIARLPNWFQRSCAANTTATYTLRPDGKIKVVNACQTAEGKTKSVTGTARVADAKGPNSKLKVTFFWPFSGDYWIIGLDTEYKWAIVGAPGRDYLWILSREAVMPDAQYQMLLGKIREQGFDVTKIAKTPVR